MPIELNGQEVDDVTLAGNTIDEVRLNGTTVYTSFQPEPLEYYWYDQSFEDSPTTESEFDTYFQVGNGTSFGGQGLHQRNVNWGNGGQTGGDGATNFKPPYLPAESYAWKVEGYLLAPETGTFTFGVDGDDAVDVFVGNKEASFDNLTTVASFLDAHGFEGSFTRDSRQSTGTFSMEAGEFYSFKARMQEQGGGDGIQVGWKKPSDSSFRVIPESAFFI